MASANLLASLLVFVTPLQAAPSRALQAVTTKLNAPDYGVRERALALIADVPRTEIEPLREALFAALRTDTAAVRRGVHPKDEGFAEYYGELLGALMKTLGPDLRAVMTPARATALVEAIYNEDSEYAKTLGTIGQAMVEPAQQCAQSANLDVRGSCLAVIGWLCWADATEANAARRLQPNSRDALIRTLRTEASMGTAIITRLHAVRALGYAHDAGSIGLLGHIVATTPETDWDSRYFLSVVATTLANFILR